MNLNAILDGLVGPFTTWLSSVGLLRGYVSSYAIIDGLFGLFVNEAKRLFCRTETTPSVLWSLQNTAPFLPSLLQDVILSQNSCARRLFLMLTILTSLLYACNKISLFFPEGSYD